MDDDLFTRPGHLIQRCGRLSTRWADARFAKLGLATAQIPVLYALKDGGSLTQKELAGLANIEQPTMAQLLARMERDGLIQRTADVSDKRSSLISLTPLALKKLAGARSVLQQGHRLAIEGFTEREIATLSRLLRRFMENVEGALEEEK